MIFRMRNKNLIAHQERGKNGNIIGSTVLPGLLFYRVTHNSLALEE